MGTLDLHGKPQTTGWTRLARSATANSTSVTLREPVSWEPNDLIIITSTSFDQEEAEPMRVKEISEDGRTVELQKPLRYQHLGDGWSDTGIDTHDGPGWASDGDQIEEYSAEVGLLSHNVIVQGDYVTSRRQQFGVQIVWHARGDNAAIGRLSNVEVRNAGQGLKLGKYPIHFHLIGNVSKSEVTNCTVHHAFNRAVAIHGISNLRVTHNVVFDTRGHAVFIEDGTETKNLIHHNLVTVIRPVWSLLIVDQSPSAFWIVNPDNIVTDNAATSSHYGFWYRALPKPDGVSGQEEGDDGIKQCPNQTPLNIFRGNVAHSIGKYGLKMSQYFPSIGGANCANPTLSTPAVFQTLTVYKAGFFGIWMENLVDIHFDGMKIADTGMAGMEAMSMNGLLAFFARSNISNTLFVGNTDGEPRERAGASLTDTSLGKFFSQGDTREAQDGMRDASQTDNRYVHAMHLPGTGSELRLINCTVSRHQAAFFGCAWGSIGRGGYETEFEQMTFKNVGQIASWYHKYSWIMVDIDGSLTGYAGGRLVPRSGLLDRYRGAWARVTMDQFRHWALQTV